MVYASMSADESCNLPMMEANAMGIPAVVFDCRGDYSDHCEYIKYGIVVNISRINKVNKAELKRFQMAISWMGWYHLCTRHLGISCLLPVIPNTKFYDFPMSLAEYHQYLDENNIKKRKKLKEVITPKVWHYTAMQYTFGVSLSQTRQSPL